MLRIKTDCLVREGLSSPIITLRKQTVIIEIHDCFENSCELYEKKGVIIALAAHL